MADSANAKPVSEKVPVSAFNLFSKSSSLVQGNLSTFAIVYLIPLLSNLGRFSSHDQSTASKDLSSVTFAGLPPVALGGIVGFGLLLLLAFFVVNVIVGLMSVVLVLRTAQGDKPKFGELWPPVKKFGPRLIGLGFLAGLYIFLGLIAFIVPGLIMIRRYVLSPYILIDEDVSVTEAMRRSAALSKPYSGAVWGVIGVTFLISMAGIVPIVGWIISFVLSVLYSVAPALRYEELKQLTKA